MRRDDDVVPPMNLAGCRSLGNAPAFFMPDFSCLSSALERSISVCSTPADGCGHRLPFSTPPGQREQAPDVSGLIRNADHRRDDVANILRQPLWSDIVMSLFDAPTLLAYLAAATVLVLIPGPGTAWIVAQTAAGGTRRGLQAGLGLETATLIHATAAGLGLSALLATSALAFELLKYAGAAYLVWLGIKAWRDKAEAPAAITAPHAKGHVYRRSVVTGVLNPKVALFFLAFLPQFVHPERGMAWLQFLVLGALLSTIGFANSATLAFVVGRVGRRLSGNPRVAQWRQRLIGTIFIGIGVKLALQQRS